MVDVVTVTGQPSKNASERAPASEWPATACVAGERSEWPATACVAGERSNRLSSIDERDRSVEVGGVEIGPGAVGEVNLRTRALPEHEVRHPQFAARSDHHVD